MWGDEIVRYGEEVVYFAVLGAGNYSYIMEWTFRDDGTILARAGSTGPQTEQLLGQGHMHDFTWRLDIDLNGAGDDSVYLARHFELFSFGFDDLFLIGVEGGRMWNPESFHTVEIFDRTLQNGRGRRTSYELVPLRSGSARHSEDFTQKDFWSRGSTEIPRNSWRTTCLTLLPITNQRSMRILSFGTPVQFTTRRTSGTKTEIRHPCSGLDLNSVPKNLFDGTPFWRPL